MSVPWSLRQGSQTGNQPERYWWDRTLKDRFQSKMYAVFTAWVSERESVTDHSVYLRCVCIVRQWAPRLVPEPSWGPSPAVSSGGRPPGGSAQRCCTPDCQQRQEAKDQAVLSTEQTSIQCFKTGRCTGVCMAVNWISLGFGPMTGQNKLLEDVTFQSRCSWRAFFTISWLLIAKT